MSDFQFEISCIKEIEHRLVFHELDLQVLVRFIMVGNQVVYGFKQ